MRTKNWNNDGPILPRAAGTAEGDVRLWDLRPLRLLANGPAPMPRTAAWCGRSALTPVFTAYRWAILVTTVQTPPVPTAERQTNPNALRICMIMHILSRWTSNGIQPKP